MHIKAKKKNRFNLFSFFFRGKYPSFLLAILLLACKISGKNKFSKKEKQVLKTILEEEGTLNGENTVHNKKVIFIESLKEGKVAEIKWGGENYVLKRCEKEEIDLYKKSASWGTSPTLIAYDPPYMIMEKGHPIKEALTLYDSNNPHKNEALVIDFFESLMAVESHGITEDDFHDIKPPNLVTIKRENKDRGVIIDLEGGFFSYGYQGKNSAKMAQSMVNTIFRNEIEKLNDLIFAFKFFKNDYKEKLRAYYPEKKWRALEAKLKKKNPKRKSHQNIERLLLFNASTDPLFGNPENIALLQEFHTYCAIIEPNLGNQVLSFQPTNDFLEESPKASFLPRKPSGISVFESILYALDAHLTPFMKYLFCVAHHKSNEETGKIINNLRSLKNKKIVKKTAIKKKKEARNIDLIEKEVFHINEEDKQWIQKHHNAINAINAINNDEKKEEYLKELRKNVLLKMIEAENPEKIHYFYQKVLFHSQVKEKNKFSIRIYYRKISLIEKNDLEKNFKSTWSNYANNLSQLLKSIQNKTSYDQLNKLQKKIKNEIKKSLDPITKKNENKNFDTLFSYQNPLKKSLKEMEDFPLIKEIINEEKKKLDPFYEKELLRLMPSRIESITDIFIKEEMQEQILDFFNLNPPSLKTYRAILKKNFDKMNQKYKKKPKGKNKEKYEKNQAFYKKILKEKSDKDPIRLFRRKKKKKKGKKIIAFMVLVGILGIFMKKEDTNRLEVEKKKEEEEKKEEEMALNAP